MNVNERIARYMAATPAGVSGNHGHPQTFKVACDLVNGWALPPLCALTWLRIYNQRCQPRWTSEELQHKIDDAVHADHGKARGHLIGEPHAPPAPHGQLRWPADQPPLPAPGQITCTIEWSRRAPFVRTTPRFDLGAFRRSVADLAHVVDADWLIRRSPVDPENQTNASFLWTVSEEGERVLIFDAVCSRGKAIWTHPGGVVCTDAVRSSLDQFTRGAREGIWFLANPVNGVWQLNAAGRSSLRSQGNITSWRYLVLESDRDDISEGEWLAFIAALPLPIAAIVETGRRLSHALIRIDAESKWDWDRVRNSLMPLFVRGGADPGSLSAVRLTRLPCCERLGWEDEHGVYHEFADGPHVQRLLYLDPRPTWTPITEMTEAGAPPFPLWK
jgi:hypothetical protein